MERFICENVFVPLRSGPSHQLEMVSQILFGEKYEVIDKVGSWTLVKTLFDNYSGWIDTAHLQQSPDIGDNKGQVLNRSTLCYREDHSKLVLEAGCEIYSPDFENKQFTLGENIYSTQSEFKKEFLTIKESIADTAMRFINSPYIWGGRVPSGIDCSGFTQLVYKLQGISLPRDSRLQAETGINIDFINETQSGDLVFFDNERGRISHVGMILSSGLFIHASGRVRIDSIDHHGIYKSETKEYSHKLRTIRRIIY